MADMQSVHRAVSEDLVALARIVADLTEIAEEFTRSETLFPDMAEDVEDIRGAVRLAAKKLAELNRGYALHAESRAFGDVLGAPPVIDQPVSGG